jgi:hypothetical protein
MYSAIYRNRNITPLGTLAWNRMQRSSGWLTHVPQTVMSMHKIVDLRTHGSSAAFDTLSCNLLYEATLEHERGG